MSSNIFQLFNYYKCNNFPYVDKDGNYHWQYKYHKYFDYWIFYYDKIVFIERIIRHRRKFIRNYRFIFF